MESASRWIEEGAVTGLIQSETRCFDAERRMKEIWLKESFLVEKTDLLEE